jgi:hypothetical protein
VKQKLYFVGLPNKHAQRLQPEKIGKHKHQAVNRIGGHYEEREG